MEATFLNHKDVPVTVWEMRVMFYKGGEEFVPEERPNLAYTGSRSRRGAFELMTLPPRIPAKRTIFVTLPLNMPDIMRTFEEADRIEFVAVIEGAGTISSRLDSWKTRPAQKERLLTRSRYYSPNVGE